MNKISDKKLYDDLVKQIDSSDWSPLEQHLKRDALINISSKLDIAVIAYSIVKDDKDVIADLMKDGKISKPTSEQVEIWKQNPNSKFTFIIVQPYILIQEQLN